MRRSVSWLASVTLALVSLSAGTAPTATAVGETCHGLPATLVGTPGQELHGTAGNDVIVTNGAKYTFADAGDDLICVTGGAGLDDMQVLGEDGADVIDSTGVQIDSLLVLLGPGADVFTGGPEADGVMADEYHEKSVPAAESGGGDDVVSTGAGDDNVSTGGEPGYPDRDSIDLGAGNDLASLDGPNDPTRPLLGGEGKDELDPDRALDQALVLDNVLGQARASTGEVVLAWGGFERFRIAPIGRYVAPSFIGGDGPERVKSYAPLTSASMGGGDDVLNLELQHQLVDHASYDGGAGADSFVLYSGAGDMARRVRMDLRRGTLLFQREKQAVRSRLVGFERQRVSASRLDYRGTRSADRLEWVGCHGLVDLGPGDDLASSFNLADVGCGYPVNHADLVVRGGGGDDTLLGSGDPNILIGGAGRDRADGKGSDRDRCVAEVEKGCEL